MAQQNGRKRSGGDKKARAEDPPATPERNITLDYIKGNYYRVVTVNGVFGGISPNGDIHMAVWNQRRPYPTQMVHEYDRAKMQAGKEISRAGREADVVREIEAGLVFNAETARLMIKWLEDKVGEMAELEKALEGMAKPETTE